MWFWWFRFMRWSRDVVIIPVLCFYVTLWGTSFIVDSCVLSEMTIVVLIGNWLMRYMLCSYLLTKVCVNGYLVLNGVTIWFHEYSFIVISHCTIWSLVLIHILDHVVKVIWSYLYSGSVWYLLGYFTIKIINSIWGWFNEISLYIVSYIFLKF